MNTKPRITNRTHKILTIEQMKVINLGPQFTMELKPNRHINVIIIETGKAIGQREPKWQNTFRYLASKQIKVIKENNIQNLLHKKQYKIMKNKNRNGK